MDEPTPGPLACWFCGEPAGDEREVTNDGRDFCCHSHLLQGVVYPEDRQRAHAAAQKAREEGQK